MTEQNNGVNRAVSAYMDATLAALDYKANILEELMDGFLEEARELRKVRIMVEAGESVPLEVFEGLGLVSR